MYELNQSTCGHSMLDHNCKRCHRSKCQARHPWSTNTRGQERDPCDSENQPEDTLENCRELGVRVPSFFVADVSIQLLDTVFHGDEVGAENFEEFFKFFSDLGSL